MRPRRPQDRSHGIIPASASSGDISSIQGSSGELLDAYFRNKDPKTVRTYRRCLEDFKEWLSASSLEEAAAKFLSSGPGPANLAMLKFKDALAKADYAPSSINTHLVALRSLVKIGRLLGKIQWDVDIQNVKSQTYQDTAGPGTDRFQAVWTDLSQQTGAMAVRDRTILALAHDAGLRRDEIESIDLEHLDWENDRVWVRAKMKASRVAVTFNKDIQIEVRKWIAIRGEQPGALFTNFDSSGKGDRLTGTSIDRICKKYGLGHVHGLRHLAITEALELTNGNVAEVMKFSRHADPKTVMIYDDNRKNAAGAISEQLANRRKNLPGREPPSAMPET
jgi:integrase/recombinase XerC